MDDHLLEEQHGHAVVQVQESALHAGCRRAARVAARRPLACTLGPALAAAALACGLAVLRT
jgi:hypothetical protein